MAIVLDGTSGITQPSVTGSFGVPAGTTAQRPASPTVGMIRYNTTESQYEVYSGTQWNQLTQTAYPYTVNYLVVAGGGGGGGGYITDWAGGTGGSGIVIISYPGSQRGTGGTVTSSGGNTIHTFTTSGTYTA